MSKKDKAIDLTNNTVLSSNRLSAQFSRVKKKKGTSNVDLTETKDSIEKNLYISTKGTSDETNEMDYTLKRMNHMGKGSTRMLRGLYPELQQDKIKAKKKTTGFKALALPAIGMGAILAMPVIASKFTKNKPTSQSKKLSEKGDPDNIFGLTSNDKTKLKRMQEKTGDQDATMDKVVRVASAGTIPSISALIFNFTDYRNSGIYEIFKTQLELFQNGAIDLFTKIFKGIINFIKENLYNPLMAPVKIGAKLLNKLKFKAINKLNQLFKLQLSNESIEDKDPVDDVGITLVGSIRQMVLSYLGIASDNNISADSDNKKGFIQKIKDSINGTSTPNADSMEDNSEFAYGGDVQIDGDIIKGGKVDKKAIFKSFREAGFGPGQAAALTAEVGRENSYNPKVLFGNHKDPARGNNIGFISWQGSRKKGLLQRLSAAGLLRSANPALMDQTYASLLVMSQYVMHEMKTTHNTSKTKQFLANPNISFAQAAPLLGGSGTYIAWARGQNTIRKSNGSRVAFNWRAHEARAAGYHKQLTTELGGTGDMVWNDKMPSTKSPKVDASSFSIPSTTIPKVSSDVAPTPLATYKAAQINTNNTSNMKGSKRSSLTSNFSQQSSYTPNVKPDIPKQSTQMRAPQPIQYQPSSNSSTSDTSSKAPIGYTPMKSFFEYLMEKDLSGNMF